jgi:hypothetical protein
MAATAATVKAGEAPTKPIVHIHEVQGVDTLTSVCSQYAADADVVRRANGIPATSSYLGPVGRKLRVPARERTILPPPLDEDSRRRDLVQSFALRNGLSSEDSMAYLKIGDWDAVKAQKEFDEDMAIERGVVAPPASAPQPEPAMEAFPEPSEEDSLLPQPSIRRRINIVPIDL